MTQSLADLTAQMLDAARRAGADASDAMAIEGTSLSIDVRGGQLEQAERSEAVDIGLRVFVGQRQACVSASDRSASTIDQMAERAVAMAKEAPEDPFAGLAAPDALAANTDASTLELSDPSPEPSPDQLQEATAHAEAAAMSIGGVTKIDTASASYGARDIYLAASNGFAGGYRRTDHSLYCVAIAGDALEMERDYDGDMRIHAEDLRGPEDIGASAGQRAVERLSPRKPPTGAYPILFDERISSSLLGHLLAAVNGSAVARGASFLRDSLGQHILPDGMDVVEDPHRARVSGSRLFDAEGLPTTRREIVKDGVLQGWTLDLATARKLGLESTGNAARSVSAPPGPSPWNVSLSAGPQSRADLVSDMGTGLLVTSMIGATINPNTGDYSRGAAGMWVENGTISHAVNEVTIAGNLKDMLRHMVPANDARPHLSRVVPSLLVSGMTLAGS